MWIRMTTPGFTHMIIALTKSAWNYAELMEDAMSRYVRPIQPIIWLALCVALLLGANTEPDAQDGYPSKPIQVVVATAAGGAADTMGRLLGERLSDKCSSRSWSSTRPAPTAVGARSPGRTRGAGWLHAAAGDRHQPAR